MFESTERVGENLNLHWYTVEMGFLTLGFETHPTGSFCRGHFKKYKKGKRNLVDLQLQVLMEPLDTGQTARGSRFKNLLSCLVPSVGVGGRPVLGTI